jgi:hypothetical protein
MAFFYLGLVLMRREGFDEGRGEAVAARAQLGTHTVRLSRAWSRTRLGKLGWGTSRCAGTLGTTAWVSFR